VADRLPRSGHVVGHQRLEAGDHLELGAVSLMRQDDAASAFYVLARQRLTGRR